VEELPALRVRPDSSTLPSQSEMESVLPFQLSPKESASFRV